MGWKVLKKRIITDLLTKDGRMVKGKQFLNHRDTGDPVSSAKVYNHQDADELIFLDINPQNQDEHSLIDIIKLVGQECFMPLTVGGKINNIDQIRNLLLAGADKVAINTHALASYDFIKKASSIFGSQCIVVSIDVKFENGMYVIYSHCGTRRSDISLEEHILEVEKNGAGEILINSIDRDGQMAGYDIKLLQTVSDLTSLPGIALGGAGNFEHLVEAFKKVDIAGVACASLFHFGDNNPLRAKSYLKNHGVSLKKI